MIIEAKYLSGSGEAALEISDIPLSQSENVKDFIQHLCAFGREYLQCLEAISDLSIAKDMEGLSILYAQVLKSRAVMDEAKQHLSLGMAAAKGDVNTSELGFPELDDPYYKYVK